MLWKTHFIAGATAGLLIAGPKTDLKTATASAVIAGLAALLPDFDSPDSKIGRICPIASWLVKFTVGHRGPLHSLLGALAVSLLTVYALKAWLGYTFIYLFPLIAAGYLSHVAMDCLNPPGTPLLWPLPLQFGLPLVDMESLTGLIIEKMIIFPGLLVMFCWLYIPITEVPNLTHKLSSMLVK